MVTKYRSKAEYTAVINHHAERRGVNQIQARRFCKLLATIQPYKTLHAIAGLPEADRKALRSISRIAMDSLGL